MATPEGEAIIVIRADSHIQQISPSAARLLNESPEALLGQPIRMLDPPVTLLDETEGRLSDLVMQGPAAPPVRAIVQQPEGDDRTVTLALEALHRTDGTETVLLFRSAESPGRRAPKEEMEGLREIAHNLDEVFWLRTRDEMLYISPAYETVWGRRRSSLYANPDDYLEAVHPADRAALIEALQRAWEEDDTLEIEFRIQRPDGIERWVHVKRFPVDAPSGPRRFAGIARDITDEKEARLRLRASEERFQRLIDNAQPIIFMIDREGIFQLSEGAGLRALGLVPGAAVGHSVYTMYADYPGVLASVDAALEGEKVEDIVEVEGVIFDVWFSPYLDEQGEVAGCIGMAVDITQREKALRELRERETQYRMLAENAHDLIWTMDEDLNFTYVSPAVERLYGYTPEELMDMRWEELLTPASRERAFEARRERERLEEDAHDDTSLRTELEQIRKDGSQFWTEVITTPLRDDDGHRIGYLGVTRDITERKRAEEALRKSEERFRAVSEQAVDIIAILDEVGHYQYLSPSIEAVTGWTRDNLIGESSFERVHPDDRDDARRAFETVLQRPGSAVSVELRYRHKRGAWHRLWVRGRRLSETGDGVEVLVNVRDITERYEREQALVAAKEKAEEMNRLKSAFLANMSHEIRTPLTSIIGFADVLRNQVEGESLELLEMIREGSARLQRTLTSVLDLAQLESETMRLRPKRLDLTNEVRSAAALFEPRARAKGIELILDVPDEPIEVELDRGALHRILSNLTSNAVKFTDEGRVLLRVRESAQGIVIQVEDTGVGIAEDHLERVFEGFAQESQGYTRDYEGVGLGLTITHRLVHLLGGTIRVESTKGIGSVFTVTLPRSAQDTVRDEAMNAPLRQEPIASEPNEPGAADPTPDEATAVQPEVLLVEDNELSREMLPLLLQEARAPYRIDTAATPEEALAKARAKTYDLIIIDINLGTTKTGVDVMNVLRERSEYEGVPMMACTAYAMPGDEERFTEAGFDVYLAKPFRTQELLDGMDAALSKRSGRAFE